MTRTQANNTPTTNPWVSYSARIETMTVEGPDITTYGLRLTNPKEHAAFNFLPGQFNMLYVPGVGEIAIGVSQRPTSNQTLDHTIRLAGRVTNALAKIGIGGTIGLRGPFGVPWPVLQAVDQDVLVIAGGTGLASVHAAVEYLLNHRDQYRRITLLYGGRDPQSLLYQHEYSGWRDRGLEIELTVDRDTSAPTSLNPGNPNAANQSTTDNPWRGHIGVVPQLLDRLKPMNPENTTIFCCGPEVMMRYTIRSAVARGIPKSNFWVSLERHMQCAIGLCGHCQMGPEIICRDGPVFRIDHVEPLLAVEGL